MKTLINCLLLTSLGYFICTGSYSAQTDNLTTRTMPTPFDKQFVRTEYPGPIIGVEDKSQINPMTQDLWTKYPELKKKNIKIYGWVEPSYNVSSSNSSNIPMSFDIVPNKLVLDQFVLTAERLPNTLQTQNIDFGFKIMNILGIDYRYTIAQGIFSSQLYQNNNLYGDDPLEFFGQIYIPHIAEGMLITIGRYSSPTDIESSLAPFSNFLTHALTMTYDAYTETGINTVVQLNKQINILLGFHGGINMAPWAAGAHPSFQFLLRWVAADNNDSIIGGTSALNDGQFTGNHDNLQQLTLTWTHRFNEHFKNASEFNYFYQFNAAQGGSCNFGPRKSFGDGGGCGPIIPGLSNAVGFLNIFSMKLFQQDLLSFRFEFFNDPQGQRTGYPTPYVDFSLGLIHAFNSYLKIRPEIRYDKAFKATPYNNGTKSEQTTFNIDTVMLL